MNTYILKTTIHCGSCINTVSGIFNQDTDILEWRVDINHPDKLLYITTNYSLDEVIKDLKSVGFNAELA